MKNVEGLFFGSSDQLFGMYHPAIGNQRNHGVVVCAPLFHEYYRSHFAMKRIAAELADKGYDVLRFDYTGTGDSGGGIPSDMFNTWSDDIGEAIAEIRQLSGCNSVSLVAMRFSGSLGLPWKSGTKKYICWDSVPDPQDYIDQLSATNSASLAEHTSMSEKELIQCANHDFLGTGWSNASIHQSLAKFVARSDVQQPQVITEDILNIRSNTDWVSASLKMIYAHDTVRQITDEL